MLFCVALEAACWRNRLVGNEPLSLGLFESIMLMRDGDAHCDGTVPVKSLLYNSTASRKRKLVAKQAGRLPVSALSFSCKCLSALA